MVRENLVFTLNQVEKDDDITWKENILILILYKLTYYYSNLIEMHWAWEL